MKSHNTPSTIDTIKLATVTSTEQARRIDQAIARRAYEIFERRGGMGWHELEDWRQAESEIRSKLCFGVTSSDDSLLFGCDVSSFEASTLEVWVAPRQMTICGKSIRHKETAASSHPYSGIVFRVVYFPVEVETARIVASRRQNFLEIRLPKVHSNGRVRAHAV